MGLKDDKEYLELGSKFTFIHIFMWLDENGIKRFINPFAGFDEPKDLS